MNPFLLALAALSATAQTEAGPPPPGGRRLIGDGPGRRYSRLPGPDSMPCPKCKAEPGEPCDRRTLGRHSYHRARVDAFRAMWGGR